MSASDNLQPLQFYHGTSGFSYNPGDLLTPEEAAKNSNYEFSDSSKVYASSNFSTAATYAKMHPNTQVGSKPVIYKVKALGPVEQDQNAIRNPASKQTSYPLEIIKKVPYTPPLIGYDRKRK